MKGAPPTCQCGTAIGLQSRSGLCRKCAARNRPPLVLTPEQRAARAAHVRAMSADPAIVAKRAAAISAGMADPAKREKHRKACKLAYDRKVAKDPAYRDRFVEIGRRNGKANFAKSHESDVRQRAARTLRARMLEWCPEEFWDLNRRLKRKGFKLDERKAIILAEVPGTAEHARRAVQNAAVAGKIKHAREVAQRY